MLDKLAEVERRFGELEEMLGDPDVIGNRSRFVSISKEHAGLTELMDVFRQFNGLDEEEAGTQYLRRLGGLLGRTLAHIGLNLASKVEAWGDLFEKLLMFSGPKMVNECLGL